MFGRGSNASSSGAWPQLGAVCLVETDTDLIRAAEFGDHGTGQLSFAKALMYKVQDDLQTIFNCAYFSAAFLLDWQQTAKQRHWLLRARAGLRYNVICQLPRRLLGEVASVAVSTPAALGPAIPLAKRG